MDKIKKKRIKKYISWIALAAFVVVLAVMPLMTNSQEEADGPQASILSGTVGTGSITTSLHGGGTLSTQEAAEVVLPSGVKITEFLVSNGDIVAEGDALAVIDRVSLMSAITLVQDTMDYLVEEMADVTNEEASTQVTAVAGGLVKQVFAEKGDNVQDVMLEHGALAVLSLDGLMAVEIQRNTDLSTGDSVCVILEDDTEISGRVDSNRDGVLVVTVEDEGYAVGASVVVKTEEGDRIGSGALYVHNAWKAVAYTGTVNSVSVKAEDTVYAGRTIMTLTDTEFNAQLEALASQHRDYEALMLEMFRMYQSGTINAPCDGMVSGVDADSIHLLSASNEEYIFSLLANAPGKDPDVLYDNHVGQFLGALGNKWLVQMNPTAQEVSDYMADMGNVDSSIENMTYFTEMEMVTVYKLVDEQWEIYSPVEGDILLFALGNDGVIWAVYVSSGEITEPSAPPAEEPDSTTPPDETQEPTQPEETPSKPESGDDPSDDSDETESDKNTDEDSIKDKLQGAIAGGSISGMFGGFSGGGVQQEEAYELFDLEGSTLMSVTPQSEMTLIITLDEQDISNVQLGMPAEITIEALKNQTFTAIVTKIGDTGSNSGGSSKFSVELTMDMQENMLSGMSAVATIPLFTTENLLLIPVEALAENGASTQVYTGYDEATGELINPITVTLGISDGIHAEVLSGLEEGDTYWYAYYDTLEIDTSVESPGFSFG